MARAKDPGRRDRDRAGAGIVDACVGENVVTGCDIVTLLVRGPRPGLSRIDREAEIDLRWRASGCDAGMIEMHSRHPGMSLRNGASSREAGIPVRASLPKRHRQTRDAPAPWRGRGDLQASRRRPADDQPGPTYHWDHAIFGARHGDIARSGSLPPRRANRRALSRSINALSASRIKAEFSLRPVKARALATNSSSSATVMRMRPTFRIRPAR